MYGWGSVLLILRWPSGAALGIGALPPARRCGSLGGASYLPYPANGTRQRAPSSEINRSASAGPQLPAGYVGIGFGECCSQYVSSGSMIFHAASTSSLRVNSVISPIITSSSSVSYAGGAVSPNASEELKSMSTGA